VQAEAAGCILARYGKPKRKFQINPTAIGVRFLRHDGIYRSDVIYKADGRNIAGTSWSPRGGSILFGIRAFNAFNLKGDFSNGRVDGGAQVAMIKPDGTGFPEVTSGENNNGFPSFAREAQRSSILTLEDSVS
jgi:hypothetical protein